MKQQPLVGVVIAQALAIVILLFVNNLNRDRYVGCDEAYDDLMEVRIQDDERHAKELDDLNSEIAELKQGMTQ